MTSFYHTPPQNVKKKNWVSIFKIHLDSNHISKPPFSRCIYESFFSLPWIIAMVVCLVSFLLPLPVMVWLSYISASPLTISPLLASVLEHLPSFIPRSYQAHSFLRTLHLLFLLPAFLLHIWIGSLSHFLHIVFPNIIVLILTIQSKIDNTYPLCIYDFCISYYCQIYYIFYLLVLSVSDIRYWRAEIFYICLLFPDVFQVLRIIHKYTINIYQMNTWMNE